MGVRWRRNTRELDNRCHSRGLSIRLERLSQEHLAWFGLLRRCAVCAVQQDFIDSDGGRESNYLINSGNLRESNYLINSGNLRESNYLINSGNLRESNCFIGPDSLSAPHVLRRKRQRDSPRVSGCLQYGGSRGNCSPRLQRANDDH
jgi:hypothetical protein